MLYRVIYTSKGPQHQTAVEVNATTVPNAVAAAKTADSTFNDVISVTEKPTGGLIVSSLVNLYRVIYTSINGPQHQKAVYVAAASVAAAIASAKAADSKFTDIITVTQIPTPTGAIISGS